MIAHPFTTSPQELAQGFLTSFGDAMARMNLPTAARPTPALQGQQTVAAQQARTVSIEDVGQEARRAAFSQGQDVQAQTAENTGFTARLLGDILNLLRNSVGGLANLGGGPVPEM